MELELRRNFISADKKVARNSFNEYFFIDEIVTHSDGESGEAKILSFEINDEYAEVKVITDKGYAHIDFLNKTNKTYDNTI
jgi:hypothetical protein